MHMRFDGVSVNMTIAQPSGMSTCSVDNTHNTVFQAQQMCDARVPRQGCYSHSESRGREIVFVWCITGWLHWVLPWPSPSSSFAYSWMWIGGSSSLRRRKFQPDVTKNSYVAFHTLYLPPRGDLSLHIPSALSLLLTPCPNTPSKADNVLRRFQLA